MISGILDVVWDFLERHELLQMLVTVAGILLVVLVLVATIIYSADSALTGAGTVTYEKGGATYSATGDVRRGDRSVVVREPNGVTHVITESCTIVYDE